MWQTETYKKGVSGLRTVADRPTNAADGRIPPLTPEARKRAAIAPREEAIRTTPRRTHRISSAASRGAPMSRRWASTTPPIRVVIQNARNDDLLASVLDAAGNRELAFDFRHDSWADVAGVVTVNDFDAEPFRYIRLREPPYSERDLELLAGRLRAPAYVFFRHEDEPTAPAYATRLVELLSGAVPPPE